VEKLDPAVTDELKLGVVSMTQAREIMQLPRGNQLELTKTLVDHDLNSRQTAVIVDEFLKTTDREQQKYILDHPLQVLERDQDNLDGDYDARLAAAGNRLLKTIKIAYRQINRLSDEAERTALTVFTAIEWMILEPELVRVARRAQQLSDFIEQLVHRRTHEERSD
jgi:hypothetical protein